MPVPDTPVAVATYTWVPASDGSGEVPLHDGCGGEVAEVNYSWARLRRFHGEVIEGYPEDADETVTACLDCFALMATIEIDDFDP